MEAEPKRKRRWFQFRLRTLMIGVTLLAGACGYVGWQAKIVRERTAWRESPKFFEPLTIDTGTDSIPWIRRLLGDNQCLFLVADDAVSDADLDACRAAFPECSVRRDRDQPKTDTVPRMEFHFRNGQGSIETFFGESRVYPSNSYPGSSGLIPTGTLIK
jgi:hypothetical protein